ncbi:Hypothetical protein GLP15_3273 [Giardia lamblia P15]|uniref:Uncharacterized protein n=1 Tax=Giardia intestinalis (strain P15) TaxID=658858 RepID=E1F2A5_GIAIA|nr:Hypothetical protein GLP15_3273 [Giardia lamblia P15]
MSTAIVQQSGSQRRFCSKGDALKYYSDHIVTKGSRWRVLKADARRIHLVCKSAGCSASVRISIRVDGSVVADEAALHHAFHTDESPSPLLAHVDNVAAAVLKEAPNLPLAHYYSVVSTLLRCSVNRKILWRARRRLESKLETEEASSTSNLQE